MERKFVAEKWRNGFPWERPFNTLQAALKEVVADIDSEAFAVKSITCPDGTVLKRELICNAGRAFVEAHDLNAPVERRSNAMRKWQVFVKEFKAKGWM